MTAQALSDQILHLVDTAAIRGVIERYFHGLDSRDATALRSCFAADFRVQFQTGTPAEFQHDGPSFAEFLVEGFIRHRARSHMIGSIQIDLNGDAANTRTQAVAFMIDRNNRGEVRGLLYEDEFAKVDGAWKLNFRKHTPKWQFSVDIETPTAFQWAFDLAAQQAKD